MPLRGPPAQQHGPVASGLAVQADALRAKAGGIGASTDFAKFSSMIRRLRLFSITYVVEIRRDPTDIRQVSVEFFSPRVLSMT
jgi:hypothetical protein